MKPRREIPVKALQHELFRLARFGVVGVFVTAIYVGTFFVLHWRFEVIEWAASLVAFALAVSCQYVAQTLFTFRATLRSARHVLRFAVTIAVGALISTGVTGVIGPGLGWPDTIAVAIVVVLVPISNFLLFRFWVYTESASHASRSGSGPMA